MIKEKPKAYIVRMSVKNMDVQIDADEVVKVIQGITTGNPIMVKQGIINPSFYVGIVEDNHRISEYLREINVVLENNRMFKEHGIGQLQQPKDFEKLKNIFDGLQLSDKTKQLN